MFYHIGSPEHSRGIVCIGRSGVDLYPQQFGMMEAVVSFSKHVGGSPANVAAQLGKLNADVAFCGKVSRDALGNYVRQYLASCGIDVSHLKSAEDVSLRQSLAIAQQPKPGEIEYFFYRTDPADLHLGMEDIDESFIRQFKLMLVSGASLAASPAREAILYAVDVARANGVDIVFDPDFRKSGWTSEREASLYYDLVASKASIVCATREEMDVIELLRLPENDSDEKSARRLLQAGVRLVCIKHGGEGSNVYLEDHPMIYARPMRAHVYKTLGAGDSYLGTLMAGILRNRSLEEALAYAGAAAAITISGRSCSDSMPDEVFLESYIDAYKNGKIEDWPGWEQIANTL